MNKEQNLETTPTNHLSQPEAGDETTEEKDREPTLTAAQCAQLAGVSVDTIEKYVSIGLLQPIQDTSGVSHYRQSDIRSLFYTRKSLQPKMDEELPNIDDLAGDDQASPELSSSSPSEQENYPSEDQHSVDSTISQDAAQTNSETSSQDSPNTVESPENEESNVEQDEQNTAPEETAPQDTADSEAPRSTIDNSGQTPTESPAMESARETTQSREVEHAQEVQYALREQIEVLKQERDWLRTRVEQLELRGEREQMLLLSESETIRRLVSQKTFTEKVLQTFRLPWLQPERK